MSSDYVYTMYRVDKFYGLRPTGAGEHLPLVPARGEDRRARAERRRQVDADAHHGRSRGAVVRRRRAASGGDRRVPAAGAAARRDEGRARQRRGRRARAPRPARPLQRGLGRVRRARRRLRRASCRAVEGAGADRPARRVGPRCRARPRHGRTAPARGRPGRVDALGRGATSGRALPPPALVPRPAPPRRADEPPRRRVGRVARAVPRGLQGHGDGRHPRPLLPRQRGRDGSSSSTAARACPSKGTTPRGSSRSRRALRSRRRPSPPGAAPSPASSSGCG